MSIKIPRSKFDKGFGGSMIDRKAVYSKFGGRCAYTGTPLKDDWQVDHIVPKIRGGASNIDNLLPVQKIVNHYKRDTELEDFRNWLLAGLHLRLRKLPKNPRTEKGKKRKEYLTEVASLFGITEDIPFSGSFYFEKEKEDVSTHEHKDNRWGANHNR